MVHSIQLDPLRYQTWMEVWLLKMRIAWMHLNQLINVLLITVGVETLPFTAV